LPTVLADDGQLMQIFRNLIGNAIKFRSEVPLRVSIESSFEKGRWQFQVRDNGIGMDMKYAERIFKCFNVYTNARNTTVAG
jgi:signal transduction histidine kinase